MRPASQRSEPRKVSESFYKSLFLSFTSLRISRLTLSVTRYDRVGGLGRIKTGYEGVR